MGMYNTIVVECPECGKDIEFQTKSGSCLLKRFYIKNVPKQELKGIMGEEDSCCNCGHMVGLKGLDEVNKIDGTKYLESWEG